MSTITLKFDNPVALPILGTGFTISDDSGASFSISSFSFGSGPEFLVLDGTWTPDDPVEGADVVSVQYLQDAGDLLDPYGRDVLSFKVIATFGEVPSGPPMIITSFLSKHALYSFDIQQTLTAPRNLASATFNSQRFNV